MRRLSVNADRMKPLVDGFRNPILEVLSALATPGNTGRTFHLRGYDYVLPTTTNAPLAYFKMFRDRIVASIFPMQLEDMRQLISDDNAARIGNGWRILDQLTPQSRRPKTSPKLEGWDCRQVLKHVFSYATFSSGHYLVWDSRSLTLSDSQNFLRDECGEIFDAAHFVSIFIEENEVSYCPYCNAETIYSETRIEDPQLHLRSDLDHFFPKWQYPYLAVSPYNLIPACTRCNSRVKHDTDPLRHGNCLPMPLPELKLAYPFRDDFHALAEFSYETVSPELLIGQGRDGDLKLKCSVQNSTDGAKAEEWARQFCLRTVYEKIYRRELRELPLRMRVAASTYPQLMAQLLKSDPVFDRLSEASIRNLILGMTFDEENVDAVRLGKLTSDIARQLGYR